jgi:hypothetical protein
MESTQEPSAFAKACARSLFEFKGNPTSFDCTEDQLARIIQGSVDWADKTREAFERTR